MNAFKFLGVLLVAFAAFAIYVEDHPIPRLVEATAAPSQQAAQAAPGPKPTASEPEEWKAPDYSRPLQTTEGAVACPDSMLSDIRSDYGPEAAKRAVLSVLGRKEKLEKLGCMSLRGGVRIFIKPYAKDSTWQPFRIEQNEYLPYVILAYHVENVPGAAPNPKEQSEARPAQGSAPDVNAKIDRMINQSKLNFKAPVYTQDRALACPSTAFTDMRPGYGVTPFREAVASKGNRAALVKKLGCTELAKGVRIYGLDQNPGMPFPPYSLQKDGQLDGIIVTFELTN